MRKKYEVHILGGSPESDAHIATAWTLRGARKERDIASLRGRRSVVIYNILSGRYVW